MPPYSPRALEVLKQAGWSAGRAFDASGYQRLLRSHRYPVFPAVAKFLGEFGALYFAHPAPGPSDVEDWHFNAARAIRHTTPDNVRVYGERAGTELCVIGEADREHLLLMMDEQGRVYAGYDQVFLHVGDSGEDALEGLCQGRKFPPVAGPRPPANR
jgi:hypothetical protein